MRYALKISRKLIKLKKCYLPQTAKNRQFKKKVDLCPKGKTCVGIAVIDNSYSTSIDLLLCFINQIGK